MGKLNIFLFSFMIFVIVGVVVYTGFDDAEKIQKPASPIMSGIEPDGKAPSIEELAAKGEKVSFEEALAKIEQANIKMKEHSEIFSISKITERFKKDGLAGLAAHFRGGDRENQNPQSQPAVPTEPKGKGAQVQRTEKDTTDSVRLEIERLRKEEDARRLNQEKAAGKIGQAEQQTVRETQGENEKKDFLTELREMWETLKSLFAT